MSSFDSSRDSTNNRQPFASPTSNRQSGWVNEPDSWASPSSSNLNGSTSNSEAKVESTVILDDSLPPIYGRIYSCADPIGGAVTLAALQRVLQAGEIKASEVEKIISLVASSSRVTRHDFMVALALLAFTQLHRTPISIDLVFSSRESLPVPTLPLSFSTPSSSNISSSPTKNGARPLRSNSEASLDPWNTAPRNGGPLVPPSYGSQLGYTITEDEDNSAAFGETDSRGGLGFGAEGWSLGEQENVHITQRDELGGGFLLKYTVWVITVPKTGNSIERRYSDFVWLLDCFIRRYPFRLLPGLPPKRVAIGGRYLATDDLFLERRRRGLTRFLNYALNHPTLKMDGLLKTFLTERTDLSLWRKSSPINLEEESASRNLTSSEEMTIPSDLENKLAQLRSRIQSLVELWTRTTNTYERIAHRRRNQGADWLRLKIGLEAAVEVEQSGWRTVESEGVEAETLIVAEYAGRAGDINETSATRALDSTVESLKRHRELYVHFRDLFARQIQLSPDSIDKLKKRTEGNMKRLELLRETKKPGWEVDADKIASTIEADQQTVERLLKRRVFIRWCMWQEMLFLFRSTSLLSVALKEFSADEVTYCETIGANWNLLSTSLP